jgi:hypothetical protein
MMSIISTIGVIKLNFGGAWREESIEGITLPSPGSNASANGEIWLKIME